MRLVERLRDDYLAPTKCTVTGAPFRPVKDIKSLIKERREAADALEKAERALEDAAERTAQSWEEKADRAAAEGAHHAARDCRWAAKGARSVGREG